jgi:predicted acylesterase/phospholipase RssA
MFDAVAFAGGGNRCYWQGGFYEAVADRLAFPPKVAAAVSAGAFACIYSVLGSGAHVRELVLAACGPHQRNFDFRGWRSGGPLCPVGPMYRALLDELIDDAALARLRQRTDLHIAVARLPFGLPPLLGAAIGIGCYQLEKHLFHPVHPRLGRMLGFRAEFIRVRELATARELRDAILASGCVPPFMPQVMVGGKPGFDGGLVDNVPVGPLEPIEAAGGCTLVLLTRTYRHVPKVPGRTYVQPSRPIGAKQFDITNPAAIRAAYELGLQDGKAFAAQA